jgi:hypothetical protein
MMNMITFRLDYALMYAYNNSNFLQPVELLGGHSMCDLVLEHQHDIGEAFNDMDMPRERLSIIEQFLKKIKLEDDKREEFFKEDTYLPNQDEISRDPMMQSPISRCFDIRREEDDNAL